MHNLFCVARHGLINGLTLHAVEIIPGQLTPLQCQTHAVLFARPSSQIGQTQFSNTVIVLIDKPNKKIFYNIRMIYIGDKIDAALLLPLQFKGKGGRDRNAY